MENFTEMNNFIKSVLIIALSEEIGLDENGMLLSTEIHLRDISNIIKDIIIDDLEKDDHHLSKPNS